MRAFKYILLLIILLIGAITKAQTPSNINYLRNGNKSYLSKDYKKAEIDYRKSLDSKPDYTKGKYNLASSLYKQEQYEEAFKLFSEIATAETDSIKKSKYYYNAGNCLLKQQKYEEAIKLYKEALKFNSKDTDAKYNLAYAQKMLEKNKNQNQQNQNQQNQDKQENQNKQQNQEKKDQKKDGQEKQQNQNDKKEEKQEKKQAQQKNQMKKQDAERMLQAMQQKEKNTKDKVDKQKVLAVPVKSDKDW